MALPTCALAGQAPWAKTASGQARRRIAGTAPMPVGRVTSTLRALAWPAGCSTTVVSAGRAPFAAPSSPAVSLGANGSLSQPVGVNAVEAEPRAPS